MRHKIVSPNETDYKSYILFKYSCYARYQDKMYTRHALDTKRGLP